MKRVLELLLMGGLVVICLAMVSSYNQKRDAIDEADAKDRLEATTRFNEASDENQRRFENKLNELRKQKQAELLAAMGGPVEAAIRTPGTDIATMLHALAAAVAPEGSSIDLKEDHFTHFGVELHFDRPMARRRLVEVAANLLTHGEPYLQRIEFFEKETSVAVLDLGAADFSGDWSQATVGTVEKYLQFSKNEVTRVSGTVAPRKSAPDPLPVDKFAKAQADYNETTSQLWKIINNTLKAQDSGVRFDSGSVDSLGMRLKELEDSSARAKIAAEFLLDNHEEYRRLLEERKFSPLFVRIALRGFREKQAVDRVTLEPFLNAVQNRSDRAKELIQVMQSHTGQWNANGEVISFKSDEAKRDFSRASARFVATTDALQSARREWERAHPAGKQELK